MIKIKIDGDDLYITGHSTSQICSSVSTITCMLHNLLVEFDEDFKYEDDGTTMHFNVKETDNSRHICKVALDCLYQLSEQYPEFVLLEQNKRHN